MKRTTPGKPEGERLVQSIGEILQGMIDSQGACRCVLCKKNGKPAICVSINHKLKFSGLCEGCYEDTLSMMRGKQNESHQHQLQENAVEKTNPVLAHRAEELSTTI